MTKLINCDSIEYMKSMPSGSVDLIVTDPPYGIKFASWDTWKKQEQYIDFMLVFFKEAERILKSNGSIYWFHNNMPLIARLMEGIRDKTNFIFNSFITCDKGDFRALSWKYPTEKNTLRTWFNSCEYCLYYNKRSGVQTEWDRTGLEKVKLDVNNFTSLRKYAYEMCLFIGGGNFASVKQICQKMGDRRAEHFLYCKKWEADGENEDRGSG